MKEILTRTVVANALRSGDVIVEDGNHTILVKDVVPNACSSRGVHVNRSMCYDRRAHVEVAG